MTDRDEITDPITDDGEQAALPGVRAEPTTALRWLYLVEAGQTAYALAALILCQTAKVPGLDEGDHELLQRAGERLTGVLMREVGRRQWEAAMDGAEEMFAAIVEAARVLAGAEDAG